MTTRQPFMPRFDSPSLAPDSKNIAVNGSNFLLPRSKSALDDAQSEPSLNFVHSQHSVPGMGQESQSGPIGISKPLNLSGLMKNRNPPRSQSTKPFPQHQNRPRKSFESTNQSDATLHSRYASMLSSHSQGLSEGRYETSKSSPLKILSPRPSSFSNFLSLSDDSAAFKLPATPVSTESFDDDVMNAHEYDTNRTFGTSYMFATPPVDIRSNARSSDPALSPDTPHDHMESNELRGPASYNGPRRILPLEYHQPLDDSQDNGENVNPNMQIPGRNKRENPDHELENAAHTFEAPAKRFKFGPARQDLDENRKMCSPNEVTRPYDGHCTSSRRQSAHNPDAADSPNTVFKAPSWRKFQDTPPTTPLQNNIPATPARENGLSKIFGPYAEVYLESHFDRYEAAKKRWQECSKEEWTSGADELVSKLGKVLDFVKDHMTAKLQLFATFEETLDARKDALNARDKTLREVAKNLVKESGNVLGGVAL